METVVNIQRETCASKFLITGVHDPTKKGWNMELINTILSFGYYIYHGYGAIHTSGFGSVSARVILCVLSLGQCFYYLNRFERGVRASQFVALRLLRMVVDFILIAMALALFI